MRRIAQCYKLTAVPTLTDTEPLVFERPCSWSREWYRLFGRRWRVEVFHDGVLVTEEGDWGKADKWSLRLPIGVYTRVQLMGGVRVASKWIEQAVKEAGGKAMVSGHADPVLHKDRPALADFMVETEGAEGSMREPSPLMVVMTPDGVRVGLKDDDAGGWCWREEESFTKALNALEKALTSGKPVFRAAGGKGGRRKA